MASMKSQDFSVRTQLTYVMRVVQRIVQEESHKGTYPVVSQPKRTNFSLFGQCSEVYIHKLINYKKMKLKCLIFLDGFIIQSYR